MKEIKEHEISNTLHRRLSVVPKTDGEIYVSINIGKYIITFTCFLHCAKKVALTVVLCNDVVGSIMNMWGYLHWNTANTIPDIYLLFVKRP